MLVGGAAALLVIVLIFAFSGGSDSKKKTETASSSSENAKTQNTNLPAINPGSSKTVPGAKSETPSKSPAATAAKTEPHELTPKEIYEQKVREGKINPNPSTTPAPEPAFKGDLLAVTTPPANDPSWKQLFNGKDLTGWETPKGTWKVENGITICTTDPNRGGSLVHSENYKDFELLIKFRCSFHAEWYIRGGGGSYYLDCRDNAEGWRIFRMVGKGRSIQASLDGKVLEAKTSDSPEGNFMAYIHQASKVFEISEFKVRELKADEAKPPAAAETPAKDLFNGKDLTGWNQTKGKWRWEDGALLNEPGETACRIQSDAIFGDCEITFKVKVEAGHHIEVQVFSYQYYFEVTRAEAPDFKECKVTLQGAKATCTIGGIALELHSEAGTANNVTSGAFGFYAAKGIKAQFKDFRVRSLK